MCDHCDVHTLQKSEPLPILNFLTDPQIDWRRQWSIRRFQLGVVFLTISLSHITRNLGRAQREAARRRKSDWGDNI